jgi:hypothetical protein
MSCCRECFLGRYYSFAYAAIVCSTSGLSAGGVNNYCKIVINRVSGSRNCIFFAYNFSAYFALDLKFTLFGASGVYNYVLSVTVSTDKLRYLLGGHCCAAYGAFLNLLTYCS